MRRKEETGGSGTKRKNGWGAAVLLALSLTPGAAFGGPVTKHAMQVIVADRAGDAALSDTATSGTNVYQDGESGVISKITDKSGTDGDVFSVQAYGDRHIRLSIPGVVTESCGYGAVRLSAAALADWYNQLPVGGTSAASGIVECYTSATRQDGWLASYPRCLVLEHAATRRWVFRAEAGCTARVDRQTRRTTMTVGSFAVPYRLDATEL